MKILKNGEKIELKNQADRKGTRARLCNKIIPGKWENDIPWNSNAAESEGFEVVGGFMQRLCRV